MIDKSTDNDRVTLHLAAAEGWKEECEQLIFSGEDVNAADDLGWTPLMHAVRNGHCQLATVLLSHHADVCQCNRHGVTVFTLATLTCDKDLLRILYDQLTPELQKSESNTALQVVCVRGCYGAVRWLLVNTPTQINLVSPITGVTPLQLAVIGHHYRLIELLLEFGADTTVTSTLGQDIFDLCRVSGDKKLFHLLCHENSPTQLVCPSTRNFTKSELDFIDPQYTTNHIYLDLEEDIIFKNSPGRPVFKTCDDDIDLDRRADPQMKSILSPSLRSVFLPSPQQNKTTLSQSWDNNRLHGQYNLTSLMSPRTEPLTSPLKSPNRGKKRKLPNKSGCSSWLRKLTKRQTKYLEDSEDDCIDFDILKQNGIDFSQLLFGLGLDEFFPTFKEQELDIWTFLTLTSEDLDTMGIQNQTSQARILKSIKMLRKTQL